MATPDTTYAAQRRTVLKHLVWGAAGAMWLKPSASRAETPAAVHVETQANGADIWQVTTESASQSNIYCEVPYCSEDSRWFVFQRRSKKDPSNPVEFVIVEIGSWRKHVLDSSASTSGSAITPDGTFYYCKKAATGGLVLMRASLPDGKPEEIHRFAGGPWTWSLGTVSPDHHYYLRGKRLDEKYRRFGMLLVDLHTGVEAIIDEDPYTFNAHPQIDPGSGRQVLIQHNRGGGFDEDGKNYRGTGPEGATLYLLDLHGKRTELSVGKPFTTPCTGHQAWAGKTGEIILTVSARDEYAPDKGNLLGIRAGQDARVVARGAKFNHVGLSRCGRLFCCDDFRGDYNVIIGSVKTGQTAVVCATKTQASRKQYSHPHAYLTPDLKWIIFNSTRSGEPHIHAARIPEGMVDSLTI